jgi:large conductance mechanosensitive channel
VLRGFKDFMMRGNVVELATAVVVGAAFTAVVTAFTQKIINPLLATIPHRGCSGGSSGSTEVGPNAVKGPAEICGFGLTVIDDNPATYIDFGSVIAALINFVIVAGVVYFLIVAPFTKLTTLSGLVAAETPSDDVILLTKIHELLEDAITPVRRTVQIAPYDVDDPLNRAKHRRQEIDEVDQAGDPEHAGDDCVDVAKS